MLQKLSNGAKGGISKFVLVGFLFMAVAGLVLTDVGGFFRDGVSSTNVAEVGSQDVPYHEFDRFLRNALSRQNISPQDAYQTGQVNQLLERYAQDILFVQASENLGVRTPDKAVAEELHRFVKPYLNDETTPQQALDNMLNQQGLSEENLVDAIRRDLTSNILKQAVLSGVKTAPEILTKELLRYENEKRDITYVTFPHDKITLEDTPTEEELQNIYDISQAQFRIPERRGFTIALLDPKEVTKDIVASDEDVRTYYDNNKIRYEVSAGQKIEQAIFDTEDAATAFISGLDDPENFKDTAGDKYRSSNIYQEDTAPDALKDILFSKESNPVRGPAQSPLGWHVIRDMGAVEATYRPFEDVQETIKIVLERDQKRDVMIEAMETINDRIDDEEPLEALVTDYNMETLSVPPIDQFGMTAAGEQGLVSFEADQPILIETTFNIYEDELSDMVELQDGRLAILKIDQVTEESVKPFADVKDQITQRIIMDRKRLANQEKTQTYLQQLKDGSLEFSTLAQENGLSLEKKSAVKRGFDEAEIDAPTDIPFDVRARIFLAEPDSYILASTPEGIMIAKSDNQRLDDVEITEETEGLARRIAIIETLSTYYNHLAEETPVQVNQRLLEQLYGQPQG